MEGNVGWVIPTEWSLAVANLALKHFNELTNVESEEVYDRFVVSCTRLPESLVDILCTTIAESGPDDPFGGAYVRNTNTIDGVYDVIKDAITSEYTDEKDKETFGSILNVRSESNLKLISEMFCWTETESHAKFLRYLSKKFGVPLNMIVGVDLDVRHRKYLSQTRKDMSVRTDSGDCFIFFLCKGDDGIYKDRSFGVWKHVGKVNEKTPAD